jgi:ATP-dependent Lhr-like helicase
MSSLNSVVIYYISALGNPEKYNGVIFTNPSTHSLIASKYTGISIDITVLYRQGASMSKKDVFEQLHPNLKKLVKRRFKEPTPIQKAVIPEILSGHNVLSLSETGSGKTEASLLPIFSNWLRDQPRPISILYITPLRSLNRNLMDRIMWWSSHLDLDASVRHGDTTQHERKLQAENPPDMLISTPETLQAILTGKILREHLKNIRYIVLDEVHELVSNKRGLQLSVGLERLKELISQSVSSQSDKTAGNSSPSALQAAGTHGSPRKPVPQIVALSATVGTPDKVSQFFNLHKGSGCKIINTVKTKKTSLRVESPRPSRRDSELVQRMRVSPEIVARLKRIQELIKSKRSVLTFTNTREFAEILSSRLRTLDKKLQIETHHSSLSKDVRISAEDGFRDEKIKSLICTSSLELGIDIGSIDLVLQYQSPRQVGKFLQRVGRSGHTLSRTSDGILISGDPGDALESTVITNLALKGWVEPTKTYGQSWDVLALQTLGLSLEEYKIPAKRAYSIIKRAHPFRNLKYEEFLETCMLLQKLRLIWVDTKYSETGEPLLKRRNKAFEHYYFNLSTIPDVRNYKIVDNLSNRPVGTLDAEFIAMHGTPNTAFIVKGQAWRILDVGKSRVLVEPMAGIEAAIPAWEGELIPVPYEVAQEVSRLREEILALSEKKPRPQLIRKLTKAYPITSDVALKLYNSLQAQKSYGFVPTRQEILIEHSSDEEGSWLIIHAPWGSLINDTLGRALSHILTPRMGSVGLQTDPYRIMLRLQTLSDWREVVQTLRRLKPTDLDSVIHESLPGGELFNWRFIHVCKRFGIISRDADFGKGYIRKISEVYQGTPPHREAINEVLQDKLDLEGAKEILHQLSRKKIKLKIKRGLSPWGEAGVRKRYEILAPLKPEKEIFSIFTKRLLDTRLGLVCTHCGDWATIDSARDVPKHPHCPLCESIMIAVVPSKYIIEAQNLIKTKNKTNKFKPEQAEHLDYMLKTASLVASSGRDAAICLAGRGIGPTTAGRILSKMLRGDDLLHEILKAERNYAKTKRFWK